jgi:hypothetical protein
MEDTLTVAGETLTMYAGILGKIDEAIGGFDKLDEVATDKQLQTEVVKAVVANYDENGNVNGYKFNLFNMSPSDFDAVLQWGLEHYTVFTMESSTKIIQKLKAMEKKIVEFQKNSQSSQNG